MIRLINGNSENFISESELNIFLQNLPWDRDLNVSKINQLHNELFDRILQEHNYLSIAELNIWGQNPESKYYNEAISILNWFTSTCVLIEFYSSTVTEKNYLEPEAFIASLPRLS